MKSFRNWKMLHRIRFILMGLTFCGWLASQAADTGTRIVAWGDNSNGQIDVPEDLTNAVFIAAGASNSAAIRADGMVVVWGNNWFGQTNVPFTTTKSVSVSVGHYHVLALRTNGFVRAWGNNSHGQVFVPGGLSNVVAIAACGNRSMALTAEGKVVAWGDDYFGINRVPEGLSNVVAITTGNYASWALTTDGKVVGWGYPALTPPAESFSNVVQISAADDAELVTLDSHGRAEHRGVEVFADVSNIVAVQMPNIGFSSIVGMTANGKILWDAPSYAWDPPPSDTTNVVAIAAGSHHGLALVDPGGELTSWRMPPPAVSNGQFVINISTHRGRSYALESRSSLGTNGWTVEKRFAGDGSLRQFSFPLVGQTFYRARRFP